MTFEILHNVLENNRIENETDREIIKLILEAERDWNTPIYNLKEFIKRLEDEIGDRASKNNLIKLQNKYQKNGFQNSAWNSESIYSLLDIFKLTETNDLNSIFNNISNQLTMVR